MNILLRKVSIADPGSSFNKLVKDIFVANGRIERIGDDLTEENCRVFKKEGCVVSPGWVDVFAHFNDPGYEFKETLESGAAAAASGGYTNVFVLPNTSPQVQNKTQVEYIVQKSKSLPVNIMPLGAVTKGIEGKDLAEMYDMYASGAVAFTDGTSPVQSAGLLLKALQYVKAFDGVVIQVPQDKSVGQYGLINEGIVSTRLGLPGIPALAEELIVARDIKLARYTGSQLHITGITTAKSLEYIKRAKEGGIAVTCSVTPYHLYFCDEDITSYDTNLKVNPPLRSKADRAALQQGVADGSIDCIATHHLPQDWDNKVCEFEYAKNGMTGLQTAYAVVRTVMPQLDELAVSRLFSANARHIFKLDDATIKEGAAAQLTIFNAQGQTILTKSNNKSRSLNSPFFDVTLQGAVEGIVNGTNVVFN